MHDDTYELEDSIRQVDLSMSIEVVLKTIPKREAKFIKMYLGLAPFKCDYTFKYIGQLHGLSLERTRQIFARGLRRLRHPNKAEYLKEFF